MSINESSATALIRFTGLGIICFNKQRQRGEIAAIRDSKHRLSIEIQRPVFQEGSNDVVTYQNIAAYEHLPNEDVRLEIKALGTPAIAGFEIYQNGEFDRLESADANDFRWIVNMNALHGETAVNSNGVEKHPITKIFIDNGLFYTHKLDTSLFFEKVATDTNGAAAREVFGNIAETIGVKLEGDEVSLSIRIGDKEETHSLKRVEGLPFKIEIKNMDYDADAVSSDMPDYYRYLSSPSGARIDLMPVIEESAAGDPVNPAVNLKVFCHPIGSDDLDTIDDL